MLRDIKYLGHPSITLWVEINEKLEGKFLPPHYRQPRLDLSSRSVITRFRQITSPVNYLGQHHINHVRQPSVSLVTKIEYHYG